MLTLVFWMGLIAIACGIESVLGLSQIRPYMTQHHRHRYNGPYHRLDGQNNHQLDNSQIDHHAQKEADDRYNHWLKLVNMKKRKLKLFKKHLMKCGFPFKVVQRADDDLDTISIKLPHGFGDDYYQRRDGDVDEDLERDSFDDLNENSSDDDIYNEDEELQPKFTQMMSPVRSQYFRPVTPTRFRLPLLYSRVPTYKPFKLVPQMQHRVLLKSKPWIPMNPWKSPKPHFRTVSDYDFNEPVPGLFTGSPPPVPPLPTSIEIPLEKPGSVTPNYIHENLEIESPPKAKKYSQPDYSIPSDMSRNETKGPGDKVVNVTPTVMWYAPIYHHHPTSKPLDTWIPMLNTTTDNFRIHPTDEPEIITAPKLDNLEAPVINVKNYNRTRRSDNFVVSSSISVKN